MGRDFPEVLKKPCDHILQPPEHQKIHHFLWSFAPLNQGSEGSQSLPFHVPFALFLVLSCLADSSLPCSVLLCSLAHLPGSHCQIVRNMLVCLYALLPLFPPGQGKKGTWISSP